MHAESAPTGTGDAGVFLHKSRPDALVEATAVLNGAAVTRADVSAIEVSGPGAVQCMQGLVTIDLEAHGHAPFQYGALLTTKGMIVSDMWVTVHGTSLMLYPDCSGTGGLVSVLHRSLPPRLAKITDRSDARGIVRLVGPSACAVAEEAGFTVPPAGNAVTGAEQPTARPRGAAPFSLQIDCPNSDVDTVLTALAAAGVSVLSRNILELSRILGGWPRLGAEIDDKTLPQEVRYDDFGGVSYTKGCYLGQETVARLHYRGHTNKRMLGLRLENIPDTTDRTLKCEDRPVGRLTSAAWFGPKHGYLGLGIVRREVGPGEIVTSGGVPMETANLPFEIHQ